MPTDCLHPTKARLGDAFMFEMLRHWLVEADQVHSGTKGETGAHAAHSLAPPLLQKTPLLGPTGESPSVRARCFGFDDIPGGAANRIRAHPLAREQLTSRRAESGMVWHTAACDPDGTNCSQWDSRVACWKELVERLPPPVWLYCENTLTTPPRLDPGVVALAPGAKLLLPIEMSLARAKPFAVSFMYLASFEGMGVALISCETGCFCTPKRVDAHLPPKPGERPSSATLTASLDVTPAPDAEICTMTVTVSTATSSGAHKWKLKQIAGFFPNQDPIA